MIFVSVGRDNDIELAVAIALDGFCDVEDPYVFSHVGSSEIDEYVPFLAAIRERLCVFERQQETIAESNLIHGDASAGGPLSAFLGFFVGHHRHQLSPTRMFDA